MRLHGCKSFLKAFQTADLAKVKSVCDSETVSLGQVSKECRRIPGIILLFSVHS
jgi:hypothetical protein